MFLVTIFFFALLHWDAPLGLATRTLLVQVIPLHRVYIPATLFCFLCQAAHRADIECRITVDVAPCHLETAHAVTAFALAFGVSAIWPRWRIPLFVYALAIALSRLVLLAHHPSDVVGGAVIGLIGALSLRTWFATRQLCFAIEENGKIVAR